MARRAQRTQCHLSDDDHEEVAESDNFSGDEISEEANESSMQTTADGMLQSLDDEALFGVVKKLVCTYVRKIISDVVGFGGSNQGASYGAAAKHVTRQSLSLFSDVIESLTQPKRDVIKSYGFGSLLLFEKCYVPISFAKWVVDHVHLSTQRIILGGMSISITPQTVHDVLGIPIGGKTISKVDPKSGKLGFLKVMQLTTLPSAKDCAENLSKENISDDDLVRNFLIVALVTFLCPNSQSYPNNEYLEPLVHMKKAEGWDWCKFVNYWLFKQIKQYHARRKTPDRISINMGGCLYILCVTYLDHLKTGEQHLPPALPRILVWKGNMIKEKCKADIVKGHTYGKLSFLPTKSTCYHKRSGSKTPPSPTDVIDRLSFKKMLHSTVNENLSPKTLDDMTSLYMKHAAAPTDSAAINAQSIICDVIGYFYHRAQEAHKSSSSQHEGNANINRDVNTEVHEKRPPTHVDVPVDMNKDTPYVFGSVRANHTNMNDAASGDTLVVPASGEDCSPTPDSIAETMKATESSSQQVYLSQGGRSQSKRRLSTSSISANNENVGCSIAGRTRSRQSSLSPSTSPNIAHQADFVDNPEAILRKRAKRLATRSSQQQETSSQVIATSDTCFDTITGHLSSFNASQAHLSKSPLLLEAGAKTVDVKQNVQNL